MRITAIPPQMQTPLPWRNGLGSTREIVRAGKLLERVQHAGVARLVASGTGPGAMPETITAAG